VENVELAKGVGAVTRRRHRSEFGSTVFVLAGVVVVIGLIFVASLQVARAAIERSDSQVGADAVALAGAGADLATARQVASENGVRITEWTESDVAVEVTVTLLGTDQQASARAQRGTRPKPIVVDVWIPVEDPSDSVGK
jgi:hypothetical protein